MNPFDRAELEEQAAEDASMDVDPRDEGWAIAPRRWDGANEEPLTAEEEVAFWDRATRVGPAERSCPACGRESDGDLCHSCADEDARALGDAS